MGVVACVATWSTHWLCWCCPRPCHSHTHTHGVVGTWWWWLCVCGVAATTTVPHSHQPPPLCPLPRPVRCACVRVCVVAPGTAAHCGGTHAGVCVCGCVCAVPTTPTTHAVHPCRLSLLALPIPHLPLTHTHGTPHATHTHGVLCVPPPIHSHTHWLPHCPHARHTHATGCACAHPPALIRHHTHTRDAQAWRMHGWLGVWSPPPRPLCPPLTHTHSGTGGGRHGGAWWCGCGLCVPPTPPTTTPSHHHHQRSCATTAHTHTRDLVDAPLPHTHATCTTTLTNACCVVPTPCHSLTHATSHTHTHNGACHRSPHRPHTHTQRMPHTHHTGEGPRARTPVGVAFGEPPPPRWSWAFAVLCWWLLVHQPLFTLTHPSTPTPSSPNHHHHHPSIPCVWCVWCGKGQHQAPQWW